MFKDHMYLVMSNQALLHADDKGVDQPAQWQSYQHLCFLKVYVEKMSNTIRDSNSLDLLCQICV